MEKLLNYLKPVVAVVGTYFTWLFGDWNIALIVLVGFIALDYLVGVIKAFVLKQVSSEIGAKGIAKKGLIFVVLIASVFLDRLINEGTWIFRTMVCYFYIANEGISLLENCACLGLPIPEPLKNALLQLKEGGKKEIRKEETNNVD